MLFLRHSVVSFRCFVRLDERFFRALSKYFLGKDGSAPEKKLAHTPMGTLSSNKAFVLFSYYTVSDGSIFSPPQLRPSPLYP